ncbi:ATP-binding protein [Azospirillum halopraeferens]|uniref:ATP-binding protein n=1 Tax=Azospirillum halopraeferens TaxID=34010 RepID=UPI000401484D|nr:ATP-binding protein [Azospirillum halopraeferens]
MMEVRSAPAPALDIPALRGFVALADTGSFTAAALRCGVTEADLRHAVRGLEDALALPLVAAAGPPRLTAAGSRLLDNARRLVTLHDDAVRCLVAPDGPDSSPCPAPPAEADAVCEAVRIRTVLADAIGCVSEGFVLFDREGQLVLCNERYRAAYPLLKDVLRPGVRFADILRKAVERGAAGSTVDDPGGWIEERLRRHIETDRPTDHRLTDGRWYRISEHATRSGGVVKILTDITELKRHEEALARSEERYRRLVETAPYGIVVWDGARVRFANRAAAALLDTDDPAAMPAVPIVGSDVVGDGEPLFAVLPPPAPEPPFAAPLEVRVAGRDGTLREVEVGVHPVEVEGEAAWFLVFDDVTQRNRAERALQQSQKMQAIGQLAGGIAHEFNNMLTAIGGFAQMARRTPGDRARVDQCLGEIVKATDRAAGLTGQLLSFGRAGPAEPARPVRVADQIEELRRFLHPILGERYRVKTDLRDADAVVMIEPGLLHQTLVNLAINARDAMPSGGTITITIDRADPDEAFRWRHADVEPGPLVAVTVRDTGNGIDPAIIDRIFEPFFTTKEQGAGTGLGLALVYSTVTRAGGAVEVASEPGEGACFTLYFPAGRTVPGGEADRRPGTVPPAVIPAAGRAETGPSPFAATVLLVEDEEQVRDFIRLTLEDMGLRVAAAADGQEALAVFAAAGGAFDLVVTDLVMPHLGGADVARTLRRECPDLPILLISGYPPQDEDLNDLLSDTRSVGFLHKPIEPDALADRVRSLVD